ncbi:MAG: hypothetical protein HYV42_00960 [Candidatus Magasanikbacteria bacterium]|nr:hypothetical protein [Candidatus Magasanikbacteria bacterium]
MSDRYYFPGQFKCMYCKKDLDTDGLLALPSDDSIDLTCPDCGAVWKFFTHVQLDHKLLKGGKFNQ